MSLFVLIIFQLFLRIKLTICSMRFAALRPYGNPNISDHWDIMSGDTVDFTVLPIVNNGTTNSTRLMRRAY